jgi:glycosyltransferase involved in cell wall biosynthesis
MAAGAIPVATKTGFAPDFVQDGVDGYLIETTPTPQEVVTAILKAELIKKNPGRSNVNLLTWDRITSMTILDKLSILENNRDKA